MMTEIRHNFTKDNSLSIQLIEVIRENIVNNFPESNAVKPEKIKIERKKWASKAWHSSTYEGQSHRYIFRLSSCEPIDFTQKKLNHIAINQVLQDHEFIMRKSFVAAIELKNIDICSTYIDIGIETITIAEE